MSARPVSEFEKAMNALHICDVDTADQCSVIIALARAAKTHLALNPDSILAVAQLLDVIAEKAQYLTDCIDGTVTEHGASRARDEDRTFQAEIFRQYHELRVAGPVLPPAGALS